MTKKPSNASLLIESLLRTQAVQARTHPTTPFVYEVTATAHVLPHEIPRVLAGWQEIIESGEALTPVASSLKRVRAINLQHDMRSGRKMAILEVVVETQAKDLDGLLESWNAQAPKAKIFKNGAPWSPDPDTPADADDDDDDGDGE